MSDIKILAIDDSQVNLILMKVIFQKYSNVKCFTEENSRGALKVIEDIKPDLIILDLMMPELDGIHLLSAIKSYDSTKHIPVFILSATNDESTKKEVFEKGASQYLTKPVDIKELRTKTEAILELI